MFILQVLAWAMPLCFFEVAAFQPFWEGRHQGLVHLRREGLVMDAVNTRRSFVDVMATSAITSLSFVGLPVNQAVASGGATAGGAYLLSAKQRYNDRVKAGVKGFLAVGVMIENGDLEALKGYFASEEIGSWKDLSAAGYLLANAFRRNSSAAPDTLPSVKVRQKWMHNVP